MRRWAANTRKNEKKNVFWSIFDRKNPNVGLLFPEKSSWSTFFCCFWGRLVCPFCLVALLKLASNHPKKVLNLEESEVLWMGKSHVSLSFGCCFVWFPLCDSVIFCSCQTFLQRNGRLWKHPFYHGYVLASCHGKKKKGKKRCLSGSLKKQEGTTGFRGFFGTCIELAVARNMYGMLNQNVHRTFWLKPDCLTSANLEAVREQLRKTFLDEGRVDTMDALDKAQTDMDTAKIKNKQLQEAGQKFMESYQLIPDDPSIWPDSLRGIVEQGAFRPLQDDDWADIGLPSELHQPYVSAMQAIQRGQVRVQGRLLEEMPTLQASMTTSAASGVGELEGEAKKLAIILWAYKRNKAHQHIAMKKKCDRDWNG